MEIPRLSTRELDDDMYVIVKQDKRPKSAKVKLGDLRRYLTASLDMKIKEVKRIAQGDTLGSSISI